MRYTPLTRAAASPSAASLPRPARIAIIGSGPSGFYAASRILSRTPSSSDVRIDIFDRLPVPHGLVRYGVAPDHPDVKNVENKFAVVSQDPRLRFAGNVNVVQSKGGSSAYPEAVEVELGVLARYYTHILFAYGASRGRRLGVPGEARGELVGVYSALEFVNWYNGHPASHDPALLAEHFKVDLANKHHMTVIGAGNVALDVARIVLRSSTPFLEASGRVTSNKAPGLAALEETDVPEPVLAKLARCKVRDVDIFARRGPAQLAFTNKEVREMLSLEGIALRTPSKELLDSALVQLNELATKGASDVARSNEIASEVRVKKRLLGLLAKGSKAQAGEGTKTWGLNFFRSPARFLAKPGGSSVGSVEWNVTALSSGQPTAKSLDAADPKKAAWASTDAAPSTSTATGQTVTTATDMIVSSVGYQSEPLSSPPSPPPGPITQNARLAQLPFDPARNIVPNLGGRIIDPSTQQPINGAYVSGWLARGPTGVIATTMMDAYSVADAMLADMYAVEGGTEVDGDLLVELRRKESRKVVGFEGWRAIDGEEKRRGEKLGKIREKILTVREMLDVVN